MEELAHGGTNLVLLIAVLAVVMFVLTRPKK